MNGREFIRRVKRYARRAERDFYLDRGRGKGSHWTVYIDDRTTIVQHGEIPPGTLASMLRQLNINPREF
jgi:mRNA interferase HicA